MDNNSIENIPKYVRKLKNFDKLIIRNSAVVPFGISNMKRLKSLELVNNTFDSLPNDFIYLEKLRELTLKKDFPIGVSYLKYYVKDLTIVNCRVINRIDTIYSFNNLERLVIRDCDLRTVSEKISNFSNLKELYLIELNFKRLPESIGSLEKLESIYISNTDLEKLPRSIYKLNLKEISLVHNNLSIKEVDQIKKGLNSEHIKIDQDSIKWQSETINN